MIAWGRTRARDRSRVHARPAAAALPDFLSLAEYDALTSLGGYASLASGDTVERASTGAVWTSLATDVLGIAVDNARVGQITGATDRGLFVESSLHNYHADSENVTGVGWQAGSLVVTTLDNAAAPDGASTADQSNVSSTGFSTNTYPTTVPNSSATCACCTLRSASGGSQTYVAYSSNGTTIGIATGTNANAWERVHIKVTSGPTGTIGLVPVAGNDLTAFGGPGPAARNFYSARHMMHPGHVHGTPVITTGAAATRAGEHYAAPVGVSSTGALTDGGRLTLWLRLAPLGDPGDYGDTRSVWYLDANNNATVNTSTMLLTIKIGGATNTCTLPSWSEYVPFDLFLAQGGSTATVVKMAATVGGTVTVPSITGSALGALTIPTALDLLCQGTTNVLDAVVIKRGFLRAGRTPSWAA